MPLAPAGVWGRRQEDVGVQRRENGTSTGSGSVPCPQSILEAAFCPGSPDINGQYDCRGLQMGGQDQTPLTALAKEVWVWCLERRLDIRAQHLPGKQNITADFLSRRAPGGPNALDVESRPFAVIDRWWAQSTCPAHPLTLPDERF